MESLVNGQTSRALSHVELLYRPGERELAKRLFALLGCRPVDSGGHFFTTFVDRGVTDWVNNVMYASEMTPEQWRLEQAFTAARDADGELGESARAYLAKLHGNPQYSFHFGMRCATLAELEGILQAVRDAGDNDPELAGRVAVGGVYRPGDPDAATDNMVQAFIRTDIVAAGLLTLGQHIELQWHT